MEKKARKKALFYILLIDIVFSILILIAALVSNKTAIQTTIIILVLVVFSILASLLLYYFIYNFLKIKYKQKESVLVVDSNLSQCNFTEVLCKKEYPNFVLPTNKFLYAIIDIDNKIWIFYKKFREDEMIYPIHPISKKEFTNYYKLKE